jgi:hypothetical protein
MEEAAKTLADTVSLGPRIGRVALAHGLKGQAHFGRLFRSHYGIIGEYRYRSHGRRSPAARVAPSSLWDKNHFARVQTFPAGPRYAVRHEVPLWMWRLVTTSGPRRKGKLVSKKLGPGRHRSQNTNTGEA